MNPDATGFYNYEVAPPGHTVAMGDGPLLPVTGYGDLRLQVEQDRAGGRQARELTLGRAAYLPSLRHNLLSAVQLTVTFDHLMIL